MVLMRGLKHADVKARSVGEGESLCRNGVKNSRSALCPLKVVGSWSAAGESLNEMFEDGPEVNLL